jgi:hypothetical protein
VDRELQTAQTDDQRQRAAARLLELGEAGRQRILQHLMGDQASVQATLLQQWQQRAGNCPNDELQQWLATLQSHWHQADASGQEAFLAWIVPVLRRNDPSTTEACRQLIASALHSPHPAVRRAAAVWAGHHQVHLHHELLNLLRDTEATVRQAALFALATAEESATWLPDEELFHWLHDPDDGVRRICHDILLNRGRNVLEIDLGRRLTHPEPAERLKLLAELRYDDSVADPEPWLHHLARDPEAAVRVAAIRAVAELRAQRRVACPPWVEAIIRADPDATAQRIMRYYLDLPLRITSHTGQPVGGRQHPRDYPLASCGAPDNAPETK